MDADEIEFEETSNEEWDSGHFCLHWADAAGCTEKCTACSHECREHGGYEPRECRECKCQGFEEESL